VDPSGIRGSLLLAGGGPLSEEIRKRFIDLAGGKNAKIVYIPTSRRNAETELESPEWVERLLGPWKELGVSQIEFLHTRSMETADKEDFIAPLRKCTGVWLAGQSQNLHAAAYLGTAVERELAALLARGGVIGGSSAGAAVQTRVMIGGGKADPIIAQGFDLLPGAIVDQHFLARNRKDRLIKAVSAHPGLFGLGIDEGTGVVVRGRSLEVFGKSTATVLLPPGDGREQFEIALKAGDRHDLVALRRAALERSSPEASGSNPPPAKLASGSLVIVGGGGMPADITRKFIELAGGDQAKIVVLPTAVPPEEINLSREGAFFRLAGAKQVTVLPHRGAEVNQPEFVAALREATAIWFGGGRQWRFVDAYEGTPAIELFRDVLARGGVIGGSSAGATIQGEYLCRGSPLGNLEICAEGYERGFGFLPGAAIDQHFGQRNRMPDMTALMQREPKWLGIGIDEATAIIVQGSVARVLGRADVRFYDYRTPPKSGDDFVKLSAGQRYDLQTRRPLPSPPYLPAEIEPRPPLVPAQGK
jgi:cyanophycinase